MDQLSQRMQAIGDGLRARLDAVDDARDAAYRLQRDVTRAAASCIRALHRHEWDEAAALLDECRELKERMNLAAEPSAEVRFSGFVMDAQKEWAEAALLSAVVRGELLPDQSDLGVEAAPWLNGLAEAGGELRRYVLDLLRREEFTAAEAMLDNLDAVYGLLCTFDYPDAITYGLKRRLDMVRAALERTQSDVMVTVREARLQAALAQVERRLAGADQSTSETR